MATIDHIRSRLAPARPQRLCGQWQHGIWVLACSRCNNLRQKCETEFLRAIDPEGFYDRGNSRKAKRSLTIAQFRLCNAILEFLRNGGEIVGDESRVKSLKHLARNLQVEYDTVKLERDMAAFEKSLMQPKD